MKLNKEQISDMIINKNRIFYGLLVFVFAFITGLLFLGKGTYSVDESVANLSIVCPESVLKGETIECSMSLNSLTMQTYGMRAKYNMSDGIEFLEIVSDTWNVTTSSEEGAVLINLSGVTNTDSVGIIKLIMPTDAKSNDIYRLELFDITIGDGEDTVLELSNVSDEIRIKSDVNTLNSITLSNGMLKEEFVKENNEYTALIDDDKTVINVVSTDENATVSGGGEVNVHYGTNNFDIIVTSETGIQNTYKLEIYREYKFSSDIYKYSEENKYIYTGTDVSDDVILSNVNLNDGLSRKIENNKLIISYGNEILKEYNLINVSSNIYDLDKEYIYTKTNIFDLSKINIVNGDMEILDNKLLIKYGNEVLSEYDILSISFDMMTVQGNVISLENKLSYDEFMDYITVANGIMCEILDGEQSITTGNIEHGMKLNVYYNNVELDSYTINVYNLKFNDSVIVDNANKYIKYLTVGTNVSKFLEESFTTTGDANLYDKNGIKKNNDDVIKSGDVLKVVVRNTVMDEFTISVLGDPSGDGKLSGLDLSIMRKHLVKWKNETTGKIFEETGVYKEALDLNEDGKITGLDLSIMRKTIVGWN